MMDLEWIRSLIQMIDESEVDHIEISRFGTRVRVSKSPPVLAGGGSLPFPVGSDSGAETPRTPRAGPATEDDGGEDAAPATPSAADGPGEPDSDLEEVTSPMVGTFYRAPAPDAPAYVEIGDRVRRGQTLCILEAMKLMNELESEVSGVVREIAVENAEPVEYGQVLFRIEPDGRG